MIGTIRKHNKLLWWIIIPITIVTFVYYFLPSRNGNDGSSGGHGNFGSINGEAITPDQFQNAIHEGRIFFRLNRGDWPDSSEATGKELQRFAEQRLVLNAAMQDYHISVPTEAAARFIRQMLGIKPGDSVPADKIVETLNKLATDGGVTMDDFDRFARHQLGQEYLVGLVGMSGKLVSPKEVEVFYRRENQPINTELVSFPAKNYYPKEAPTEKELQDFYDKQQANYRVPDKITINYVEFNASNYIAATEKQMSTNLNDLVDQSYLQRGAEAFKDASGKQLDPTEAKARVRKQIVLYYSALDARKAANALLNALSEGHDDQHPYTPGDLAMLARTNHLVMKTSAPFDVQNPPKDLPLPPKSLHMLFSMTADDPDDKERSGIYAQSAVEGENGFYVAGLKDRIPSRILPLAEIREKVINDYRENEAMERAAAAGKRFEQEVGAGMAQGKTFDTMCAAQFVRPKKLTPFSLSTAAIPEVAEKTQFEQLQDLAGRMHPGQFSPFMPTTDGGYLIYVKSYGAIDEATMQRDMPAFLERMRDRFQMAAFNTWFSREFQTHFAPPPGQNLATGG